MTGFYVLPRVRGENVVLEVSPYKSSRTGTSRDNVDTQSAHTTVTGRIGEWIPIGGVTREGERSQDITGTTVATEDRRNTGIWVRADLVQ